MDGSHCFTIRTETWIDWYNFATGELTSSRLKSVNYSTICQDSSGGGSNDGYLPIEHNGGSGTGNSGSGYGDADVTYLERIDRYTKENSIDDKIDTDQLDNLCVKDIIKKLQEKDTHNLVIPELGTEVSHLSQIILDLFDQLETSHLKFLIDDLDNKNAQTIPVRSEGQTIFNIILDRHYVENATQLAIARTLIHENIHAYLSYIYNNSTSELKNLLINYFNDNGYNQEDAQHQLMAEYVEALSSSLAAWDNHSIPEDSDTMTYYDALAWSGEMIQTDAFSELDQDFKDLIIQANRNEGNAHNEANNNAKGYKCP